jgi:hypothetical protein
LLLANSGVDVCLSIWATSAMAAQEGGLELLTTSLVSERNQSLTGVNDYAPTLMQ